jgi:hypothetical protein
MKSYLLCIGPVLLDLKAYRGSRTIQQILLQIIFSIGQEGINFPKMKSDTFEYVIQQ